MKSCVLAMPVLKRPSSNSSAMPKKKPAKETIPGTVACLRKGIQNDDDNADADGDEGQRDKLKAEKWARLRATGALPEYLLQLYDQESKQSPMGKRAFQTTIINKLFKKVNGAWQLDTSDAQFKDYKSLYERRYSKEENEAMPKSLIVGLYYQGDEQKFNRALELGELQHVKDDGGVRFYSYKKLTSAVEKGSEQRLEAIGTKKGKLQEFHEIGDLLSKLSWTFRKKPGDQKELTAGSLPTSYESLIRKAHGACEKLSKDTLKLQKEVGHERKEIMKDGYKSMSAHLAALDHMKNFVEMPDGTKLTSTVFESALGDVASSVDQLNTKIEEIKGYMKSKTK